VAGSALVPAGLEEPHAETPSAVQTITAATAADRHRTQRLVSKTLLSLFIDTLQ
jgi:hypothetical protein